MCGNWVRTLGTYLCCLHALMMMMMNTVALTTVEKRFSSRIVSNPLEPMKASTFF